MTASKAWDIEQYKAFENLFDITFGSDPKVVSKCGVCDKSLATLSRLMDHGFKTGKVIKKGVMYYVVHEMYTGVELVKMFPGMKKLRKGYNKISEELRIPEAYEALLFNTGASILKLNGVEMVILYILSRLMKDTGAFQDRKDNTIVSSVATMFLSLKIHSYTNGFSNIVTTSRRNPEVATMVRLLAKSRKTLSDVINPFINYAYGNKENMACFATLFLKCKPRNLTISGIAWLNKYNTENLIKEPSDSDVEDFQFSNVENLSSFMGVIASYTKLPLIKALNQQK